MAEGYQKPISAHFYSKAIFCMFAWTMETHNSASNLADCLLCNFRVKYCNQILVRYLFSPLESFHMADLLCVW